MRYLNLGFLVVLSLVIGCSGPPSVPDRPEESQVETGPLVDGLRAHGRFNSVRDDP